MANRFYRFRSCKSIFEFEELQNQEIYFASQEELNDPMEGYRDIFWRGDKIVWKNLFKHYLLCLERVMMVLAVNGEEYCKIDENNIPIFAGFDDFPTPMYKELFENIASDFFSEYNESIKKIATRTTPVRRAELHWYLNAIHLTAIKIIQENYEKSGLLPKQENSNNQISNSLTTIISLVDSIEQNILENGDEDKIGVLFDVAKYIQLETKLINKFAMMKNTPNRNFVLMEFPDKYINCLEKLMYPKWYTACFMSEKAINNSSVWGHYGDGHKGVCLIFESDENNFINLYGKNGWGGSKNNIKPSFGWSNSEFQEIKYQKGFEEIDFWKSLGNLPIPILNSTWFFDEQANKSVISDFMLGTNEDEWRKVYWENFYRDITIKLKDWTYEQEYRLILTTLLDNEIEEQYRKLKYDFRSLKGLIFGIKMSEEDKIKIIEIIGQKCKETNRTDFELYEAYYSHKDKNIQHRKLGLSKF
ncbi:MAG: DUF2971 domain-containing protein [Sulfuricurvum sp.]